jgi:hypothetical protein
MIDASYDASCQAFDASDRITLFELELVFDIRARFLELVGCCCVVKDTRGTASFFFNPLGPNVACLVRGRRTR